MLFIKLYTTIHDDSKVRTLARELKIPYREAVGALVLLWVYLYQNRRSGDVGDYTPDDFAYACRWDKSPDVLIDALVKSRLIDVVTRDVTETVTNDVTNASAEQCETRYKIHGWEERWVSAERATELARIRQQKKRTRDKSPNEPESKVFPAFDGTGIQYTKNNVSRVTSRTGHATEIESEPEPEPYDIIMSADAVKPESDMRTKGKKAKAKAGGKLHRDTGEVLGFWYDEFRESGLEIKIVSPGIHEAAISKQLKAGISVIEAKAAIIQAFRTDYYRAHATKLRPSVMFKRADYLQNLAEECPDKLISQFCGGPLPLVAHGPNSEKPNNQAQAFSAEDEFDEQAVIQANAVRDALMSRGVPARLKDTERLVELFPFADVMAVCQGKIKSVDEVFAAMGASNAAG